MRYSKAYRVLRKDLKMAQVALYLLVGENVAILINRFELTAVRWRGTSGLQRTPSIHQ